MTQLENKHAEYLLTTVTSTPRGNNEKLKTRVRYMLDQLTEHVALPYEMTLEGRITSDRHGNVGVYVFLKVGEDTFPGRSSLGNEVWYIEETKGGKWIGLGPRHSFDPKWEARDINKAVAEYRLAQEG